MSTTGSADPPFSFRGADDTMVDSSMLLKLISMMQSQGIERISLSEMNSRLIEISNETVGERNGFNANVDSSEFLNDSIASSISSTLPSPVRPNDPQLQQTVMEEEPSNRRMNESTSGLFNFKTPMKAFVGTAATSYFAPKQETASSVFTAAIPAFSLGQPDHKAQVAAIKKKGSVRGVKKKAMGYNPSPSVDNTDTVPPSSLPPASIEIPSPVPPPSHSSPEHSLDSPVAASKPYSFGNKLKSNSPPVLNRFENPPPPPPPPPPSAPENVATYPVFNFGSSSKNSSAFVKYLDEKFVSLDLAEEETDSSTTPSHTMEFLVGKFSKAFDLNSNTFPSAGSTVDSKPTTAPSPQKFTFSFGESKTQKPGEKTVANSEESLAQQLSNMHVNGATLFGPPSSSGAAGSLAENVNPIVFNMGSAGSNDSYLYSSTKKVSSISKKKNTRAGGKSKFKAPSARGNTFMYCCSFYSFINSSFNFKNCI